MKKLNKLLLVHWFYFSHEVIEFSQLNFLTGKNASGKSTIIDALQLLFLADTSGRYFNNAANGRGNRTLLGYLRGELGDDGESGYKYLRNSRFTSYIAAEFYDDIKDAYFTAGCCFDYYSDSDIPRSFFCYDGKMQKDNFMVDSMPMDISALRKFITQIYPGAKSCMTDSGKQFREYFYGRLGALPEKFGRVFKKAVPFTPISDIKKFITEFVCDDAIKPDTSLMQDTINHYKELEKKSQTLSKQINDLKNIQNVFDAYSKYEKQELLYSYLIDRSDLEQTKEALCKLESCIKENLKQIDENNSQKINAENEIEYLQHQRDNIINAISNNDVHKRISNLEAQRKEIEYKIKCASNNFANSKKLITDNYTVWKLCCDKFIVSLENFKENSFPSDISKSVLEIGSVCEAICTITKDILHNCSADNIYSNGLDVFKEHEKQKADCRTQAIGLSTQLYQKENELNTQLLDNKKELAILKKGNFTYPREVSELKKILLDDLQSIYGINVDVNILAELLEIKSERWRNAIEGYLNSQKYYIVVAPEHFKIASEIYNRIKNSHNIHGVGLINIKEITSRNTNINQNSLVEEIVTDNKYARCYINYLLGNVIKCDNVKELTQYSVSITDECMLYKGYVLRHINPKTWKSPAIGKIAIERKIEFIESEIHNTEKKANDISNLSVGIKSLCEFRSLSDNDILSVFENAKGFITVPELNSQLSEIEAQIKSIDKSPLTALEQERETIESRIKDLNKFKEKLSKSIERLTVNNENIVKDIKFKQTHIKELSEKIKRNYTGDWIEEIGENKFNYEYDRKNDYETILINFRSSLAGAKTLKGKQWDKLVELRTTYINNYKEGYAVIEKDNTVYGDKLRELSEVKLPEYECKIQNAKEKSYEQFQEDFLSKMKINILNAENQINELNASIKGNFSGDQYKFKATPNKDYRLFYNMFTSTMLEGGYNLFSHQFNEAYQEEIKELFDLIVNNTNDEEYRKKIEIYTDYRTYLDFDLQVISESGNVQHLSKTLTKKSGGETQTPFYIAVLASFAQVYRIGRDKTSNTIRIIIFDEAFSKMDGERIRKSIELLRNFNFQVILSAPPDKVPDIATLVDRNLAVVRSGNVPTVKVFDPKDIELGIDENE